MRATSNRRRRLCSVCVATLLAAACGDDFTAAPTNAVIDGGGVGTGASGSGPSGMGGNVSTAGTGGVGAGGAAGAGGGTSAGGAAGAGGTSSGAAGQSA